MKKRVLTADQQAGAAVAAKLGKKYLTMWLFRDQDGDMAISIHKPPVAASIKCPSCKKEHPTSFEWPETFYTISNKHAAQLCGAENNGLTQLMLVPVESE